MSVAHRLRPMEAVVILLYGREIQVGGLDLVNRRRLLLRNDAVGAAFYGKGDPLVLLRMAEKNFRLVVLAPSFLDPAVDAAAFLRAVHPAGTVINAAAAQDEFHQLPHRQLDVFFHTTASHCIGLFFAFAANSAAGVFVFIVSQRRRKEQ